MAKTMTVCSGVSSPSPSPPTRRLFQALQHRDFRLLWSGLVISAVGTWMQIVSQSLLVLHLTHNSALALGSVSLAQALSFFLFSFVGGAIADRFDQRQILLITQSISLLLAVFMGLLTVMGVIHVWMIVVLAFCSGMVLSFDQPTRTAMLPLLVPRNQLMNAISLQSLVFNGASVVGPALAGVTVGIIGYAGNFFLNALSYLGVLIALLLMRVPSLANTQRQTQRTSLVQSIRVALATVRRDKILPWILSGYGALLFCGPSSALILPIFATTILQVNAVQLGLLFSGAGIGTVIGGLLLASRGDFRHKGALWLAGLVVWASAFALFALSHFFLLTLLALCLVGVAQTAVGSTTILLLQTRMPPQMRGRVMSLNTLLLMGVRPLGDFPAGVLVMALGASLTVLLSAGIVGSYALYLLLQCRELRTV